MSELQGPRVPGEERSGRRRPILWIVLGLITLVLLALLVPFACQALSGGGDPSGSGGEGGSAGGGTTQETQQGSGGDPSGGDTSGGGTTTAVEGGASGGETTGGEDAGARAEISAELERPADQRGDGSEVTVPRATISGVSGWIAIHRDSEGEPGDVIGTASLREGENADVSVSLDEPAGSGTLYAMVHAEDPADNRYTFPDGDPPVQVGRETVVEPFRYTVTGAGGEPLPGSGGISLVVLAVAGGTLALSALAACLLWLRRRGVA